MKEAKLLEKQPKKQTSARKSKHTGSMPDITADNLTLDEATDGLPADAAADNIQQKRTHTIIKVLQSKVNRYSTI